MLHSATIKNSDAALNGATLTTVRIACAGVDAPTWTLQLWIPQGDGPFPVVLTGDACWHYATDKVKALLLSRSYILAQFNRTEVMTDTSVARQTHGFASHGALAGWRFG